MPTSLDEGRGEGRGGLAACVCGGVFLGRRFGPLAFSGVFVLWSGGGVAVRGALSYVFGRLLGRGLMTGTSPPSGVVLAILLSIPVRVSWPST